MLFFWTRFSELVDLLSSNIVNCDVEYINKYEI